MKKKDYLYLNLIVDFFCIFNLIIFIIFAFSTDNTFIMLLCILAIIVTFSFQSDIADFIR